MDASLRFDDLRETFESQSNFSSRSAVGRRLVETLNFLNKAFPDRSHELRNRSIVQSIATLAAQIVSTGRAAGQEQAFHDFAKKFVAELSRQVELGQDATDIDYISFQRSVNANVRGGVRTRDQVLVRKLLRISPIFGQVFDQTLVQASGLAGDVKKLGESLAQLIHKGNIKYSASHGKDLFKPTNKTVAAVQNVQRPVRNYTEYRNLIGDLYFIFWESVGERLGGNIPGSYADVNALRTDLEHDIDHGSAKKVAAKRKKLSKAFTKYSGGSTPSTLDPEQFVVFQANLLSAIEADTVKLIDNLG